MYNYKLLFLTKYNKIFKILSKYYYNTFNYILL